MSHNAAGRSPAELQAAADRARGSYEHEKAVALYSRALEKGDLPPEVEYELRDGRSWCNERLALFETADADLQVMLRLAEGMGDVRRRIESHARRSLLANRASAPKRAEAEGRAGLALAQQASAEELESQILAQLALAVMDLKRPEEAREYAERALALARGLDDPYSEAWALMGKGFTERATGHSEKARDYLLEALPIARRVGDSLLEAYINNGLGISTWDVSQRRHHFERAVALAERIDDRRLKGVLYNNLGFLFHNLGLYQRGCDYARRAVDLSQVEETGRAMLPHLFTLAECYLGLGQTDMVRATVAKTLPITREAGPTAYGGGVAAPLLLGLAALEDGRPAEARNHLQEAQAAASDEVPGRLYADATARIWLAAAELALGNVAAARAYTRDIPETDSRTYPPQQMWWWRYRALAAGEDTETFSGEAWQALERARELMLENVANLSDEGLRRNYVNKVAIHRDITLEWAQQAVRRGVSLAPFTDREVASGNLQEQMTRLVEIGTRLAAHRDPLTLAQFLIEEFVELSGAERALLLLAGDEDESRVATSFTAREEGVSGAQTLARPLLEEMQWERQAVLRQEEGAVPSGGVPECHYRSVIALPLLARGNFMGMLYGDMRHIFGRFDQADLELLTLLANQAAAALENASWTQTLEQRVARRTEDLQAAAEQLQQQNAELAIINNVQSGLAAQLDMQGIYDLVGDEIRHVFDAQVVTINRIDHERQRNEYWYVYEKGQRLPFYSEPVSPLIEGFLAEGKTLLVNEAVAEMLVAQHHPVTHGEAPRSVLSVPLRSGDKVTGYVSLQNIDREHAFGQSHVRLLETLANSMSVALENARLFEAEQGRVAELQVINSIQQGLVARIGMQEIYDLIGDQVQGIFDAQAVMIVTYDHERDAASIPYMYEKGERFYIEEELAPLNPLAHHLINTKETLVINEDAAAFKEKLGMGQPAGEPSLSMVFVPLLAQDRVNGFVSLQNVDREHAFSNSDVRLLETLTASMSVALENARLFDETQRRAREMAALTEVGRDISATLDLPTVLERIAGHARELLATSDSAVFLPAETENEMRAFVALGSIAAQVKATVVRHGEGIIGDLWQRGEAEVLNDAANDPRALRIEGTEQQTEEKMMVAPLLSGEQVAGMMVVWRAGGDSFAEVDLAFLEGLARQAAIAIENAGLYSEAEAARRAAEEANRSKSEFLANVSHELRTPLTSILGFARLVQKRLEDRVFSQLPESDERLGRTVRQISDNLEIILGEGQRLTTLINNVLDLEKIEAGQMEWHLSPLSVAEVIGQAAQATDALIEQSGLVLVQDVPQDLPEITGDRDKLVQVAINLVANAAKFTESGTITCRARLKGAEVWVSVEDTGMGIRPENVDKVFEKFRQVGDTLTDKPKGTGLGLPICKEIVERHGGRIWVESTPGEGSTFTFTLPVADTGDAEDVRTVTVDDLLGHLKKRIPAAPKRGANGRKTLLVADDDASIRELLRQELSAEGYQVFEADNGREALVQIQALQPDLVILDVLMPELSGFDVAAVLKNDPRTMGMPVVILSVLEDKERGFRLGVDRYLTKPINMQALMVEVEALLAQGTSRRRVLVVDEDAQTVQTVSKALQAQGYEVTAVTSGEEGIREALSIHPDMIIVNDLLSQKHDMVQAIRFERGLENVLFLLVQ